jgi:L-lactate dehydrogenase
MFEKSKIGVIGTGFVGASIAYTLAVRQAASEMVLIDVAKDKASGEADDIKHGLCFLGEMNIYSGDYSDLKDCDIIIMTAGANRKPGETRLDLANKNVAIAKDISDNIMKYYNKGVLLVVANPVDILTYKFTQWTGLPKGTVFGTGTSLDSARFRSVLSDLTDVDVNNIHGYILGEHGDTQVPIWSNTNISGIPVDAYCRKCGIQLDDARKEEITEQIKTSGASIIKRKGATYYGIAVCVSSLVNSIMHNKNTVRTVSTVLDGQLGIRDVAISLPTVIGADGAGPVIEPDLTPSELQKLIASAEACKDVLNHISL